MQVVGPSLFTSQGAISPTKQGASRRQRNQPSRHNDLEFAAELGQGLIVEVRKLQGLLSERDESLRTLQLERSRLEQHAMAIDARLKSMDDSEQRFKEENWNLELSNQDLRAQQAAQKESELRMQAHLAQLEYEKTAIIKELDEVKLRFSKLSDELETKCKHNETEIGSLRRALATNDSEKAALEDRVEELNTELAESRSISMRLRIMQERQQAEDDRRDPFDLPPPDDDTPENSPPPSPTKHTPRHGQLETETLKSSLHHAHRLIQNLRSNLHREKTEKSELKRLLQESRDELEATRNGFSSPPPQREKRRRPDGTFKKPPRASVGLLGGARRSRDEVVLDAAPAAPLPADDEWEEAHDDDDDADADDDADSSSDTPARRPPGAYVSSVPPTDAEADSAFETANEKDSTDVFDTANDDTETEAYRTGAESPVNDNPTSADDLTETEQSSLRTLKPKGSALSSSRSLRPLRLAKLRHQRSSIVSTASTEDDDDDDRYRYDIYRCGDVNMDEEVYSPTPDGRFDDDEMGVAPVGSHSARLKLRISRARGRGSRTTSAEAAVFNSNVFSGAGSSPASLNSPSSFGESPRAFRSVTSPDVRKSLFAELGDSPSMMSTDGEDPEDNTPSKRLSPSLMPREMVDCGVMTEVPYPEIPIFLDDARSETSERPSTAVTVVNDSGLLGIGSIFERKPELEPTKPGAGHFMSDAAVQSLDEIRPALSEIGVQSDEIHLPPTSEMGTQVDELRLLLPPTSEAGTQVLPTPTSEMATQSDEIHTSEMATQSDDALPTSEMATQSDEIPTSEMGTQSDDILPPPTSEMATQSDDILPPPTSEIGTQSDEVPPPLTSEVGTQSDEIRQPPTTERGTQSDPEPEKSEKKPTKAIAVPVGVPPVPGVPGLAGLVPGLIPAVTGLVPGVPVPGVSVPGVRFGLGLRGMAAGGRERAVAPPVFRVVLGEALETVPVEEPAPGPVVAPAVAKEKAPVFAIVQGGAVEIAPIAAEPLPAQVLEFSTIVAESTAPVPPQTQLRPVFVAASTSTETGDNSDEDNTPKKVSELTEEMPPRPLTPSPGVERRGFFSSLFGSRKQTVPETSSISSKKSFSSLASKKSFSSLASKKSLPAESDEDDNQDTIRRRDTPRARPALPMPARLVHRSIQTDPAAEDFIDRAAIPPRGSLAAPTPPFAESVGRVRLVSNSPSMARPGSSSSLREQRMQLPPPLPHNHHEHRIGGLAGAHEHNPMPPPPIPTHRSNVSFRPRTPGQHHDQSRRPETPASTPKPPRFSATRSEISSPGSRCSSISSFATELDDRFNMQSDTYPARTANNDGTQSTDPRVIQAITQTMIGEYLWKYTRNAGRGSISHTRHKRFFWVHPYTRTLYWSDRDPQSAGRAELRAKSVAIEAVRVVTDDNVQPPGLHRKSLVVVTPGRTLKFTAPTRQRHETWFNALSYLLLRDGQEAATDGPSELTEDDLRDYNPTGTYTTTTGTTATGTYSTAEGTVRPAMHGASSLSSFRSRTTRDSSPTRNTSSLSNRRPGERERLQGSLSRLGNIFRPASGFGTYSSRNGDGVYGASDGGNSNENLETQMERQEMEREETEMERMENVRACCDGLAPTLALPPFANCLRQASMTSARYHEEAGRWRFEPVAA